MWLVVGVLCVDLLEVHQGSLPSEEMSVKAKAGINSQNIMMTTKFKIKISWLIRQSWSAEWTELMVRLMVSWFALLYFVAAVTSVVITSIQYCSLEPNQLQILVLPLASVNRGEDLIPVSSHKEYFRTGNYLLFSSVFQC